VRWLLTWRPLTLTAHRARLLTLVATLGCLVVNEVARLQVCDLWFDYLMSYGVPCFEEKCSVHINRRKNDTQRKGHYPAFGRSQDCAKRARPEAACELCPPLFLLSRCAKCGVSVA
jgi:hypothetical protein